MTRLHRRLFAPLAALLLLAGASAAAAQELEPASHEPLPVPTVTIYPGDLIDAGMLTERNYPPGTSSRFPVVNAPAVLLGKVARRTLLPGKAIPLNAFAEPDLVTRGSTTQAVLEVGGLYMTTIVQPLQSGALGALIQARNLDSGQVIAGTVQADGTLRVGTQ